MANEKVFPSKVVDLRDYFAARAMQGIISDVSRPLDDKYLKRNAEEAYKQADAMMEARKCQS